MGKKFGFALLLSANVFAVALIASEAGADEGEDCLGRKDPCLVVVGSPETPYWAIEKRLFFRWGRRGTIEERIDRAATRLARTRDTQIIGEDGASVPVTNQLDARYLVIPQCKDNRGRDRVRYRNKKDVSLPERGARIVRISC